MRWRSTCRSAGWPPTSFHDVWSSRTIRDDVVERGSEEADG
jgi:hypothetical protein